VARSAPEQWRRNLAAVTAASFLGYTGFTLVMPFLPLFIVQLGVTDVGDVAVWTGLSLGVTPGLTALLSPLWGRLADRFGKKIMVERSLASFVVLMAAMAFVTRAWQVLALRVIQGLFAGYGSLSLTMAAESSPRDRMPQSIGLVQTAQRLGPAVGPVIGGVLAGLVGLRRSFLATAMFYAVGLVVVFVLYDERATQAAPDAHDAAGRITFKNVLAFRNFILLMGVIFAFQFVDRSYGPVLPLYLERVGVATDHVALIAGLLFSIMACTGAIGHHFCGKLLRRYSLRVVIAAGAGTAAFGSALLGATGNAWLMAAASAVLGIGIGAAMTAGYTAAGAVIPHGAHGTGFGVLTSASLAGMAISPVVAGFVSGTGLWIVFVLDVLFMSSIAAAVHWTMMDEPDAIESPAIG
jgi:MFS transporter, DHA1 family, multidrug resistance protein